jgi:phenylacetate-CoA ligase
MEIGRQHIIRSVYSWLVPRIMLPLYDRLSGRRLWSEVLRLRELQWRSSEELEARALVKLRGLLEHAVVHVPYYRELFGQARLKPGDIRKLQDLSRLPVTTKADLRAGFPTRAVADNLSPRRRWKMTTGGSSGIPLEFYADRAGVDIWLGTYFFFLEWAGSGLWDTAVLIDSPAHVATNVPPPPRYLRVIRRLVLGERTVYLSAIEFTTASFRAAVSRLVGRPYFIRTLPSYASRLAADLVAEGDGLPAYPKVVISHGETLTATNVAIIEQAFRCPVVDQYSAWDVPQIAQTCPDNPAVLHVNSERAITRVVCENGRDAAPGEVGRLVITDLANEVMPFINYEIGDTAAAGGPCSCGRGFPTLTSLEGRIVETIRTPDGRVLSPGILSHLLVSGSGAVPYIWEYQAVQTAPAEVALRVVPTARFDAVFAARLRGDLEVFLGPNVSLTVETVERIPTDRSGKRPVIKSELAESDQSA